MILAVAALATWQIIEIWHHSSLLAPLRARVEMWTNKLGELLVCPFCLSPWVAMLCVVCLCVPSMWLASWVVYAFAAARLANLGNDFFKQYTLTPKVNFDDYFADLDADSQDA